MKLILRNYADLAFRVLTSYLCFGSSSIRSSFCDGFGDYVMGGGQYRDNGLGNALYRKCHHFVRDRRIVVGISQCGLRGGWFLGRFFKKGLVC